MKEEVKQADWPTLPRSKLPGSKSSRKNREKKILKSNIFATQNRSRTMRRNPERLTERVRFHLSKNRDVGDIAIRENTFVSVIQPIINSLKNNP